MQWPSPWGTGYPGWHIECTVMGQKYLGETLDIHGGGIENVFPHHEDEIAQAEAASGKPFVKYWLHNNMVTVGGQKMGKSLGNFLTLRDAFEKWPPMVIRLFILQSHYRSPTDFSEEALEAAKEGHKRLLRPLEALGRVLVNAPDGQVSEHVMRNILDETTKFNSCMDDDFNTPAALAVLFDFTRNFNALLFEQKATKAEIVLMAETYIGMANDILGIHSVNQFALRMAFEMAQSRQRIADTLQRALDAAAPSTQILLNRARKRMLMKERPETQAVQYPVATSTITEGNLTQVLIQTLINLRNEARKAKDFKGADAIRARLAEAGILLEDTPDGTTWRMK
jgi:cysteinyl-tRNA synthetase